jgi:pilus assembly protein CpaE
MQGNRQYREQPLTALLIAPDRTLAQQLAAALHETRAFQVLADLKTYPPRNTLEIRLRQLRPDVVLIDVASRFEEAAELIRVASLWRPPTPIVALHRNNDSAVVIAALRSGASEFLYAPFDPVSQRDAATRIRRLRQSDGDTPAELGKVVVFSAAKPGAGSSTLATHTAHAIRKQTGQRVLLMDFDLLGGAIGFYLKLQASYSVVDALAQVDQLDAGLWAALTQSSAGVDVLPAPETPYGDPVEQPRLNDLLEYSRRLYDWVIIDTPTIFHRTSLLSVSESDQTFLVSTTDLASLHLARRAISVLQQLGFSRDRYQIVINRMDRRNSLAGADLNRIFNCPVPACIPNDYFTLHRVISLGDPMMPDCDLGRAIANLATHVSGAGDPQRVGMAGTETRITAARTLEERA